MTDSVAFSETANDVLASLRADLAGGDMVGATVAPILKHLIDSGGNSMFADAVVSGIRGMVADLTNQLLSAQLGGTSCAEPATHEPNEINAFTGALSANTALVSHLHALALEWQLTQQLQARLAIDPVLTPLVQAQMGSGDAETATLAMKLLAAQARFCQDQRRMKMPLTELPGDLLHSVLVTMRTLAGVEADERAAAAEGTIRARYDESRSRLGIAARLVTGLGGAGLAALSISHAGAALFITAMGLASGQDRDCAALSTNESQLARLALTLRACGLKPHLVQDQFLALHPDVTLPDGFEQVGADQAAALLSSASSLAIS